MKSKKAEKNIKRQLLFLRPRKRSPAMPKKTPEVKRYNCPKGFTYSNCSFFVGKSARFEIGILGFTGL